MKERIPAWIIDIDGVLADSEIRDQFEKEIAEDDWSWFEKRIPTFPVNQWCADLIESLSYTEHILFITARDARYEKITRKWLNENLLISTKGYTLLMRPENDKREDRAVKHTLYNKYVAGKFAIKGAIDDRKVCAELWNSLGITSLHFIGA